jgi:nicotinamide-nucleotide amidase
MKDIAAQIHRILLKNKKSLAVAESCTGGILSGRLTQRPGSSGFFRLGLVVYDNRFKESLLKIPHRLILKNGAVSKEVAQRLAAGIRRLAKTDLGIGLTGIAGPAGGRPGKPAGTVFISLDNGRKNICRRFLFTGNRSRIRKSAVITALKLIKKVL